MHEIKCKLYYLKLFNIWYNKNRLGITNKKRRKRLGEKLNKYGLKPGQTLFIGNDSRCDIDGAKQVEVDTFYVNSNISPKDDKAENADYIVDNFTEWLKKDTGNAKEDIE